MKKQQKILSNIYWITVQLLSFTGRSVYVDTYLLQKIQYYAPYSSIHSKLTQSLQCGPPFITLGNEFHTTPHSKSEYAEAQQHVWGAKEQDGKEDTAKAVEHGAWVSTVCDPTVICSRGTISAITALGEKSVPPWQCPYPLLSPERWYLCYNWGWCNQNQSFDGKCRHLVHSCLQHF